MFLKLGYFSFGIIHIAQLKMNVLKFWISGGAFFQQNNKLIDWKQSLIVAFENHILFWKKSSFW